MRLDLPVTGMTCASCARHVQKSLVATPGVAKAEVNYATGRATVEHDPDAAPLRTLMSAVREAGYDTPPPVTLDMRVEGGAAPELLGVLSSTREGDHLRVEYLPGVTDRSAIQRAIEASGGRVLERSKQDEDPLEKAQEEELRTLRRRVVIAAVLSAPAIVLGMAHGLVHAPRVELALVTPVVLYAGATFHRAAWSALRHRFADMNTLVSIGTLSAYVYSVVVTFRHPHLPVYFEASAAIVTLVLVGRWLEARARLRTGDAIRALSQLQAKRARVERGGEIEIDVEDVIVGDRVVVRPGERIAVDGVVLEGSTAIDESMLTGESVPVEKHTGSNVFAATLNGNGAI
ncbi:MAG: heavy metal translocating P-type ATPase, partial [Polyangiales bacterium]